MDVIKNFLLSPKLYISTAIVVICVAVWFLYKQFIKRFSQKKKFDFKKEANLKTVSVCIKYLLIIFAAITVLQIYGINVTSIVTGLGVAGIIVGFALQDILKDLIMGINIVWDDFFTVGDYVSYGNVTLGKITHFNLKVTKIYDLKTGNTVTVSNRNINEITKLSDWLLIKIPYPYEIDLEKAKEISNIICDKIKNTVSVKSIKYLGITEFADSSVNHLIKANCKLEKFLQIKRDILGIIYSVFEENDISVPYQKIDINLYN